MQLNQHYMMYVYIYILYMCIYIYNTVGGRNPAPVGRWFMPLFFHPKIFTLFHVVFNSYTGAG